MGWGDGKGGVESEGVKDGGVGGGGATGGRRKKTSYLETK